MISKQRTEEPIEAELELLSAWLDGELEPAQARALLDRLKRDPNLRVHFEGFNLAGDAIRSHEVAACHAPQFVGRVCRALEAEPTGLSPGAWSASKLRRHAATGIGVAAAAAMLVVVVLPQLRGSEVAPTAAPVAVVGHGPGKAVAAKAAGPNTLAARSAQLDAYFRAHRELADTGGVMPSAAAYIRSSGEQDR
jgi:negative regulator of sigma E activity